MSTKTTHFENLKPGVSKHNLLLIAGLAWTIAGGILLFRGLSFFQPQTSIDILKVLGYLSFGVVFYAVMFSKISAKHIQRITTMPSERPFILAFFNARSYLFIPIMIGTGITLRKTGIVPLDYLSGFYLIMGTPLLLSAFRFYYAYIRFDKKNKSK